MFTILVTVPPNIAAFYFVCSSDLVNSSVAGYILNDGDNTSDHLAIVCQFTVADMFCDAKSSNHCPVKLLWDKADLDMYQSLVYLWMHFCAQHQTVRYTVHK